MRSQPGVVMLLANRDGSIGGAQRQAGLLAGELARRGLSVFVVNQAPRFAMGVRGRRDGDVECRSLPVLGRATRWSFFLAFSVWAAVNRRRFDLIHAHGTSGGVVAGLVGGLLRKPVVVKVTGMGSVVTLARPGLGQRLRRWILNRCDALVAVSAEMERALTSLGLAGRRCVLIPNGVGLEVSAGEATAPRARPADDAAVTHRVLYVGRLTEVKGVRTLLRAWGETAARHRATLLVVGDGPLRRELEVDVVARRLGGSVRFLGSQPDVTPFYRNAHVFVLPSATEGLSNALLEAMAAGLPVIASDVAANRDVVEHGVSGFLVNWADTAACDRLLTPLLADAELRACVGAAARARAARFSIAGVGDRYCELYGTVTRASGRSPSGPV